MQALWKDDQQLGEKPAPPHIIFEVIRDQTLVSGTDL
jgi:hypothetical protein